MLRTLAASIVLGRSTTTRAGVCSVLSLGVTGPLSLNSTASPPGSCFTTKSRNSTGAALLMVGGSCAEKSETGLRGGPLVLSTRGRTAAGFTAPEGFPTFPVIEAAAGLGTVGADCPSEGGAEALGNTEVSVAG